MLLMVNFAQSNRKHDYDFGNIPEADVAKLVPSSRVSLPRDLCRHVV